MENTYYVSSSKELAEIRKQHDPYDIIEEHFDVNLQMGHITVYEY
jgi:hypothetical protein